jgi:manganese/zinc/iron transport system permease protein
MQPADIALMGGIAGVALLAAVLFLKEFALVCFNDAFARVDGWPVGLIDLVMMALAVLVTVAGLQAVGLILVVAMLIIPRWRRGFWTERLWRWFSSRASSGRSAATSGSVVSAILPRKPAGAVIVLTSPG